MIEVEGNEEAEGKKEEKEEAKFTCETSQGRLARYLPQIGR